MDMVTNSSGFIAPWDGKLIPCNTREDCAVNHTVWRTESAACTSVQGHSAKLGYFGYCRCNVFSFRAGPLCLERTSFSVPFFIAHVVINLAQAIILLILLLQNPKVKNQRLRLGFKISDSMIKIVTGLAVLNSLCEPITEWYVVMNISEDDLASVTDGLREGIIASIYLGFFQTIRTSITYLVTAWRLYKLVYLAFAVRKSKENHSKVMKFAFFLVLMTQVAGAIGLVIAISLKVLEFGIIWDLGLSIISSSVLCTVVWRITYKMKIFRELQSYVNVLLSRTVVVATLNLLTIALLSFGLYGFYSPKLVDEHVFHYNYLSILAKNSAAGLPLIGFLYFYNGLCHWPSHPEVNTSHVRDKANSFTETKHGMESASNGPLKQYRSVPNGVTNSLLVNDDEIEFHALTVT